MNILQQKKLENEAIEEIKEKRWKEKEDMCNRHVQNSLNAIQEVIQHCIHINSKLSSWHYGLLM
jgi:hypothetical protein